MTDELTSEVPDREKLLRSLWNPTPDNLVAKLPRGKGPKEKRQKGNCDECGGYHELPAFHLDYLGHADTTRVIAEVDPFWQWEPRAGWDDNGESRFIRNAQGYPIRLWIDLTVLGVTRPGVGTVELGKGDPEKELIGDAIRNAAMRFGVGADLWSKAKGGGLEDHDRPYTPAAQAAQASPPPKTEGWESALEEYEAQASPPPKTEGWESALEEYEAHAAIQAQIAALPEDHEVRQTARQFAHDHGWPLPRERFGELANLVDDATPPGPPEPPEAPSEAPTPTATPPEPTTAGTEAAGNQPEQKPETLADRFCPWCERPLGSEGGSLGGKVSGRRYHPACIDEEQRETQETEDYMRGKEAML